MTSQPTGRFVVSVLVADRVGILRDITTAIAGLGGNIDGISQTVVEGYFTVILTATLASASTPRDIEAAVVRRLGVGEASVVVRPYDKRRPDLPTVEGDRYILTVMGPDRAGLLSTITTFLAEKGINVEDWYVEFGPATRVTHIGLVTVPERLDIQQTQDEFRTRMAALGLSCGLQHENIFRATSELGAVRPLLREHNRHA